MDQLVNFIQSTCSSLLLASWPDCGLSGLLTIESSRCLSDFYSGGSESLFVTLKIVGAQVGKIILTNRFPTSLECDSSSERFQFPHISFLRTLSPNNESTFRISDIYPIVLHPLVREEDDNKSDNMASAEAVLSRHSTLEIFSIMMKKVYGPMIQTISSVTSGGPARGIRVDNVLSDLGSLLILRQYSESSILSNPEFEIDHDILLALRKSPYSSKGMPLSEYGLAEENGEPSKLLVERLESTMKQWIANVSQLKESFLQYQIRFLAEESKYYRTVPVSTETFVESRDIKEVMKEESSDEEFISRPKGRRGRKDGLSALRSAIASASAAAATDSISESGSFRLESVDIPPTGAAEELASLLAWWESARHVFRRVSDFASSPECLLTSQVLRVGGRRFLLSSWDSASQAELEPVRTALSSLAPLLDAPQLSALLSASPSLPLTSGEQSPFLDVVEHALTFLADRCDRFSSSSAGGFAGDSVPAGLVDPVLWLRRVAALVYGVAWERGEEALRRGTDSSLELVNSPEYCNITGTDHWPAPPALRRCCLLAAGFLGLDPSALLPPFPWVNRSANSIQTVLREAEELDILVRRCQTPVQQQDQQERSLDSIDAPAALLHALVLRGAAPPVAAALVAAALSPASTGCSVGLLPPVLCEAVCARFHLYCARVSTAFSTFSTKLQTYLAGASAGTKAKGVLALDALTGVAPAELAACASIPPTQLMAALASTITQSDGLNGKAKLLAAFAEALSGGTLSIPAFHSLERAASLRYAQCTVSSLLHSVVLFVLEIGARSAGAGVKRTRLPASFLPIQSLLFLQEDASSANNDSSSPSLQSSSTNVDIPVLQDVEDPLVREAASTGGIPLLSTEEGGKSVIEGIFLLRKDCASVRAQHSALRLVLRRCTHSARTLYSTLSGIAGVSSTDPEVLSQPEITHPSLGAFLGSQGLYPDGSLLSEALTALVPSPDQWGFFQCGHVRDFFRTVARVEEFVAHSLPVAVQALCSCMHSWGSLESGVSDPGMGWVPLSLAATDHVDAATEERLFPLLAEPLPPLLGGHSASNSPEWASVLSKFSSESHSLREAAAGLFSSFQRLHEAPRLRRACEPLADLILEALSALVASIDRAVEQDSTSFLTIVDAGGAATSSKEIGENHCTAVSTLFAPVLGSMGPGREEKRSDGTLRALHALRALSLARALLSSISPLASPLLFVAPEDALDDPDTWRLRASGLSLTVAERLDRKLRAAEARCDPSLLQERFLRAVADSVGTSLQLPLLRCTLKHFPTLSAFDVTLQSSRPSIEELADVVNLNSSTVPCLEDALAFQLHLPCRLTATYGAVSFRLLELRQSMHATVGPTATELFSVEAFSKPLGISIPIRLRLSCKIGAARLKHARRLGQALGIAARCFAGLESAAATFSQLLQRLGGEAVSRELVALTGDLGVEALRDPSKSRDSARDTVFELLGGSVRSVLNLLLPCLPSGSLGNDLFRTPMDESGAFSMEPVFSRPEELTWAADGVEAHVDALLAAVKLLLPLVDSLNSATMELVTLLAAADSVALPPLPSLRAVLQESGWAEGESLSSSSSEGSADVAMDIPSRMTAAVQKTLSLDSGSSTSTLEGLLRSAESIFRRLDELQQSSNENSGHSAHSLAILKGVFFQLFAASLERVTTSAISIALAYSENLRLCVHIVGNGLEIVDNDNSNISDLSGFQLYPSAASIRTFVSTYRQGLCQCLRLLIDPAQLSSLGPVSTTVSQADSEVSASSDSSFRYLLSEHMVRNFLQHPSLLLLDRFEHDIQSISNTLSAWNSLHRCSNSPFFFERVSTTSSENLLDSLCDIMAQRRVQNTLTSVSKALQALARARQLSLHHQQFVPPTLEVDFPLPGSLLEDLDAFGFLHHLRPLILSLFLQNEVTGGAEVALVVRVFEEGAPLAHLGRLSALEAQSLLPSVEEGAVVQLHGLATATTGALARLQQRQQRLLERLSSQVIKRSTAVTKSATSWTTELRGICGILRSARASEAAAVLQALQQVLPKLLQAAQSIAGDVAVCMRLLRASGIYPVAAAEAQGINPISNCLLQEQFDFKAADSGVFSASGTCSNMVSELALLGKFESLCQQVFPRVTDYFIGLSTARKAVCDVFIALGAVFSEFSLFYGGSGSGGSSLRIIMEERIFSISEQFTAIKAHWNKVDPLAPQVLTHAVEYTSNPAYFIGKSTSFGSSVDMTDPKSSSRPRLSLGAQPQDPLLSEPVIHPALTLVSLPQILLQQVQEVRSEVVSLLEAFHSSSKLCRLLDDLSAAIDSGDSKNSSSNMSSFFESKAALHLRNASSLTHDAAVAEVFYNALVMFWATWSGVLGTSFKEIDVSDIRLASDKVKTAVDDTLTRIDTSSINLKTGESTEVGSSSNEFDSELIEVDYGSSPILHALRASLRAVSAILPLLMEMRAPCIKKRHLESLYSVLEIPLESLKPLQSTCERLSSYKALSSPSTSSSLAVRQPTSAHSMLFSSNSEASPLDTVKLAVLLALEPRLPSLLGPLQNITRTAAGEGNVSSFFLRLEHDWLGASLIVSSGSSNGVSANGSATTSTLSVGGREDEVVSNLGDLLELLEESFTELQSIRSALCFSAFERLYLTWEHRLLALRDVLESWVLVQSRQLSIGSLFLKSQDLRKRMPLDTQRMQLCDRQCQALLAAVKRSPCALFLLNKTVPVVAVDSSASSSLSNSNSLSSPLLPTTVKTTEMTSIERESVSASTLEQLAFLGAHSRPGNAQAALAAMEALLDKTQTSLVEFLSSMRQEFAHFYFLKDEDLLQLLGGQGMQEARRLLPQIICGADHLETLGLAAESGADTSKFGFPSSQELCLAAQRSWELQAAATLPLVTLFGASDATDARSVAVPTWDGLEYDSEGSLAQGRRGSGEPVLFITGVRSNEGECVPFLPVRVHTDTEVHVWMRTLRARLRGSIHFQTLASVSHLAPAVGSFSSNVPDTPTERANLQASVAQLLLRHSSQPIRITVHCLWTHLVEAALRSSKYGSNGVADTVFESPEKRARGNTSSHGSATLDDAAMTPLKERRSETAAVEPVMGVSRALQFVDALLALTTAVASSTAPFETLSTFSSGNTSFNHFFENSLKLSGSDSTRLRRSLTHIIIELVHLRDVTAGLLQWLRNSSSGGSHTSFEWLRLLRMYLVGMTSTSSDYSRSLESIGIDKPSPLSQTLSLCASTASLAHSFEYTASCESLVITPLTERASLVLLTAARACLGGCPFGPAGTGKTETVKSLSAAVGRRILVFNCDDTFNFSSLGSIMRGLCSSGAWGCFDELNRLDGANLSAISGLIREVQHALATLLIDPNPRCDVLERNIQGAKYRVHRNSALFITINPTYRGRTPLPPELKVLFRPVAMLSPDSEAIARVSMFTLGFRYSERLAEALCSLFQQCARRLSSRPFYDFGLRALKSVIRQAGSATRFLDGSNKLGAEEEAAQEAAVLLRAVRLSLLPRIAPTDVDTFAAILHESFISFGELVSTESGTLADRLPLALAISADVRGLLWSRSCETVLDLTVATAATAPIDSSTVTNLYENGLGGTPSARCLVDTSLRNLGLTQPLLRSAAPSGVLPPLHSLQNQWMSRVLQLCMVTNERLGVLLLGPASAGKASARRVAADAVTRLTGRRVHCVEVDPKALWQPTSRLVAVGSGSGGANSRSGPAALHAAAKEQLYGRFDPVDGSWADGLLTRVVREAVEAHNHRQSASTMNNNNGLESSSDLANSDESHDNSIFSGSASSNPLVWICLTGEVDSELVETLNSVLDDTRTLSLASGERLPIPPSVRFFLEVDSISALTPATVSRCGVVVFDAQDSSPAHCLAATAARIRRAELLEGVRSEWARRVYLQRMTPSTSGAALSGDSPSAALPAALEDLENDEWCRLQLALFESPALASLTHSAHQNQSRTHSDSSGPGISPPEAEAETEDQRLINSKVAEMGAFLNAVYKLLAPGSGLSCFVDAAFHGVLVPCFDSLSLAAQFTPNKDDSAAADPVGASIMPTQRAAWVLTQSLALLRAQTLRLCGLLREGLLDLETVLLRVPLVVLSCLVDCAVFPLPLPLRAPVAGLLASLFCGDDPVSFSTVISTARASVDAFSVNCKSVYASTFSSFDVDRWSKGFQTALEDAFRAIKSIAATNPIFAKHRTLLYSALNSNSNSIASSGSNKEAPVIRPSDLGRVSVCRLNLLDGSWVQPTVEPTVLRPQQLLGETFIPTQHTAVNGSFLASCVCAGLPLVLCGPAGSGKTTIIKSVMRDFNDSSHFASVNSTLPSRRSEVVSLSFSATTTTQDVLREIESRCLYEHRHDGWYLIPVDRTVRRILVFCDEVNLPAPDTVGSRYPLQFLRSLVKQGGFWVPMDIRKGLSGGGNGRPSVGLGHPIFVKTPSLQLVAASNPPSDAGRHHLPHRLLAHSPVLFLDYQQPRGLLQVYGAYSACLSGLHPSLANVFSQDPSTSTPGAPLARVIITVYTVVQQTLKRSTTENLSAPGGGSTYMLSPRDLTRWISAISTTLRSHPLFARGFEANIPFRTPSQTAATVKPIEIRECVLFLLRVLASDGMDLLATRMLSQRSRSVVAVAIGAAVLNYLFGYSYESIVDYFSSSDSVLDAETLQGIVEVTVSVFGAENASDSSSDQAKAMSNRTQRSQFSQPQSIPLVSAEKESAAVSAAISALAIAPADVLGVLAFGPSSGGVQASIGRLCANLSVRDLAKAVAAARARAKTLFGPITPSGGLNPIAELFESEQTFLIGANLIAHLISNTTRKNGTEPALPADKIALLSQLSRAQLLQFQEMASIFHLLRHLFPALSANLNAPSANLSSFSAFSSVASPHLFLPSALISQFLSTSVGDIAGAAAGVNGASAGDESLSMLAPLSQGFSPPPGGILLYPLLQDRLCVLLKALSMPGQHVMLLGESGASKHTALNLAANILGLNAFMCSLAPPSHLLDSSPASNGGALSANNSPSIWSVDILLSALRASMKACALKHQSILLILPFQESVPTAVWEIMNGFLSSGDIVGIFEGNERVQLLNQLKEQRKRELSNQSPETVDLTVTVASTSAPASASSSTPPSASTTSSPSDSVPDDVLLGEFMNRLKYKLHIAIVTTIAPGIDDATDELVPSSSHFESLEAPLDQSLSAHTSDLHRLRSNRARLASLRILGSISPALMSRCSILAIPRPDVFSRAAFVFSVMNGLLGFLPGVSVSSLLHPSLKPAVPGLKLQLLQAIEPASLEGPSSTFWRELDSLRVFLMNVFPVSASSNGVPGTPPISNSNSIHDGTVQQLHRVLLIFARALDMGPLPMRQLGPLVHQYVVQALALMSTTASQLQRLSAGSARIESAASQMQALRQDLQQLSTELEQQQSAVTLQLSDLENARAVARAQTVDADALRKELMKAEETASQRTRELQSQLARGEAALKRAQSTIQGMPKQSWDYLRRLVSPATAVRSCIEAVVLLLCTDSPENPFNLHIPFDANTPVTSNGGGAASIGIKLDWKNDLRRVLLHSEFLGTVERLQPQKLSPAARALVQELYFPANPRADFGFTRDALVHAYRDCGIVYDWLRGLLDCAAVFEAVEPLRQQAQLLDQQNSELRARLASVELELRTAKESGQKAEVSHRAALRSAEALSARAVTVSARVEHAQEVLGLLGEERGSWLSRSERLRSSQAHAAEKAAVACLLNALGAPLLASQRVHMHRAVLQLAVQLFSRSSNGEVASTQEVDSSASLLEVFASDEILLQWTHALRGVVPSRNANEQEGISIQEDAPLLSLEEFLSVGESADSLEPAEPSELVSLAALFHLPGPIILLDPSAATTELLNVLTSPAFIFNSTSRDSLSSTSHDSGRLRRFSAASGRFLKDLEAACQYGGSFIITEAEQLRPVITPLLRLLAARSPPLPHVQVAASSPVSLATSHASVAPTLCRLGNADVSVSPHLRLIFHSADPLALQMLPQALASLLMPVNFGLSGAAVRAQLTARALRILAPQSYRTRAALLAARSAAVERLWATDGQLLLLLASVGDSAVKASELSLMESPTFAASLRVLKAQSRAAAGLLQALAQQESALARVCEGLSPVVEASAAVWSLGEKAEQELGPLYPTSLPYFLRSCCKAFWQAMTVGACLGLKSVGNGSNDEICPQNDETSLSLTDYSLVNRGLIFAVTALVAEAGRSMYAADGGAMAIAAMVELVSALALLDSKSRCSPQKRFSENAIVDVSFIRTAFGSLLRIAASSSPPELENEYKRALDSLGIGPSAVLPLVMLSLPREAATLSTISSSFGELAGAAETDNSSQGGDGSVEAELLKLAAMRCAELMVHVWLQLSRSSSRLALLGLATMVLAIRLGRSASGSGPSLSSSPHSLYLLVSKLPHFSSMCEILNAANFAETEGARTIELMFTQVSAAVDAFLASHVTSGVTVAGEIMEGTLLHPEVLNSTDSAFSCTVLALFLSLSQPSQGTAFSEGLFELFSTVASSIVAVNGASSLAVPLDDDTAVDASVVDVFFLTPNATAPFGHYYGSGFSHALSIEDTASSLVTEGGVFGKLQGSFVEVALGSQESERIAAARLSEASVRGGCVVLSAAHMSLSFVRKLLQLLSLEPTSSASSLPLGGSNINQLGRRQRAVEEEPLVQLNRPLHPNFKLILCFSIPAVTLPVILSSSVPTGGQLSAAGFRNQPRMSVLSSSELRKTRRVLVESSLSFRRNVHRILSLLREQDLFTGGDRQRPLSGTVPDESMDEIEKNDLRRYLMLDDDSLLRLCLDSESPLSAITVDTTEALQFMSSPIHSHSKQTPSSTMKSPSRKRLRLASFTPKISGSSNSGAWSLDIYGLRQRVRLLLVMMHCAMIESLGYAGMGLNSQLELRDEDVSFLAAGVDSLLAMAIRHAITESSISNKFSTSQKSNGDRVGDIQKMSIILDSRSFLATVVRFVLECGYLPRVECLRTSRSIAIMTESLFIPKSLTPSAMLVLGEGPAFAPFAVMPSGLMSAADLAEELDSLVASLPEFLEPAHLGLPHTAGFSVKSAQGRASFFVAASDFFV